MTFKELKQGMGLLLAPGNNTKRAQSIGDAYTQYYKVTLVPLVAYVILSFIFVSAAGSSRIFASIAAPLLSLGAFAMIAVPVVFVWIMLPISAFIDAAIFHVVGVALGTFRHKFENTLTALIYSRFPLGIFAFMLAVPFVTPLYFVLFGAWAVIISIIALANLQKISWVSALGIIVISVVVVMTLVALIAFVFAVSLGSSISMWMFSHSSTAWTW